MIQSWLIDENEPKNLEHLVTRVLDGESYWTNLPKVKESYAEIPLDVLGDYNGFDTHYTFQLHKKQRKTLDRRQRLLADALFIPLIKCLVSMEKQGICCSRDILSKLLQAQKSKVLRLRRKVSKAYPQVNTKSSKQLQKLLFKTLGLKPLGKTKTGWKVDKEVIAKLAIQEPKLLPLAELRKTESRIDRVLAPWMEHAKTGFIHTQFGLGATVTGRLNSTNPNMQNIDREGVQRQALVSRFPGGKIIQADYGQHELRCYAAITGDKVFLDGWKADPNYDPHQQTKDDLAKLGVITDRQTAKNVNFSILYDISPWGLKARYNIPLNLGKKLIPAWHAAHPALKRFWASLAHDYNTLGYVTNIFGQRRHIPKVQSEGVNKRHLRQAYNFPVSSVAVELCYLAMIELDPLLVGQAVLIHQIHDSMVADSPPDEIHEVSELMKGCMLEVPYRELAGRHLKHDIPLAVDLKIGDTL